jgi:predicted RNA-binding Zn ribbon-like protein
MAHDWNKHRFSGGVLVFDLINTVVHRRNPELRTDRLADPAEVAQFAKAAQVFRDGEVRSHSDALAMDGAQHALLVEIRESAYSLFESFCEGHIEANRALPPVLRLIAEALDHTATMPFAADVALSALRQISANGVARVKTCPNCDWILLDKSRNGSRIWCDMAVCGNRHKARLHYMKRTKAFGEAA